MSLTLSADHRVFDGQVGGTVLFFCFVSVSTIIPFCFVLFTSCLWCTVEQGGFSRSWHRISATLGDCYCKWKEVAIVFWRILCGNLLKKREHLDASWGPVAWSTAHTEVTNFVIILIRNHWHLHGDSFSPFNVCWEAARHVLRTFNMDKDTEQFFIFNMVLQHDAYKSISKNSGIFE